MLHTGHCVRLFQFLRDVQISGLLVRGSTVSYWHVVRADVARLGSDGLVRQRGIFSPFHGRRLLFLTTARVSWS